MAVQVIDIVKLRTDLESGAKTASELSVDELTALRKAKREEIKAERRVDKPTETEYKGHPVLTIPLENEKPFSFGKAKARGIIKHYKAIQQFANS